MDGNIKASGWMIRDMERERCSILMDQGMWENGTMGNRMDMESYMTGKV